MKKLLLTLKDFCFGLAAALFGWAYLTNAITGIKHFIAVGASASAWGGVGHFLLGVFEVILSIAAIYVTGKALVAIKKVLEKK
jgi:hypothetical protein